MDLAHAPSQRLRTALLPAVTIALAAPLLGGCGLLDGGSRAEEATAYLPADVAWVQFVDRAAMAKRLGVADIDPRAVSEDDLTRYTEALQKVHWTTPLALAVRPTKDSAFNEFDVEWSASYSGDSGTGTVYKVGDDVSFDELAQQLTDGGYEAAEVGGLDGYTVGTEVADTSTGLLPGGYPLDFTRFVLDPDEQLIATASSADGMAALAGAITDEADSLADDPGELEELLGETADAEYATLVRGDRICAADAGQPATPAEQDSAATYDDLGSPEARGVVVTADDDQLRGEALLVFADDDAASADAKARGELVDEGTDPVTRQLFDDIGDFDVEADGSMVRVGADGSDDVRALVDADRRGGGPAFCLSPGA